MLNVKSDGTVSVNSPQNSVSPGDYISIYGTGISVVYNAPPPGVPTPPSPLTFARPGAAASFDFVWDPGFARRLDGTCAGSHSR